MAYEDHLLRYSGWLLIFSPFPLNLYILGFVFDVLYVFNIRTQIYSVKFLVSTFDILKYHLEIVDNHRHWFVSVLSN